MKNLVYCLHGFLGMGSDWDHAISYFNLEQFAFINPSFFSPTEFSDLKLETFVNYFEKQKKLHSYDKKIFIGYSLGARIGLSFLFHFPEMFDHFVFVSAHPGLTEDKDKKKRLLSDQDWAYKLSSQDWDEFLSQWNNQDVLKSHVQPVRNQIMFSKDKLKYALTDWSLGNQIDYRAVLLKHQTKITWVVGDQDKKFCDLAEDLKQKKTLLEYKRVLSGHRILFENPKAISELILNL